MNTTHQVYDFLAPPSQPEDLGMLGAYRIISELGKGGMGYVFRAEDTRLKRTVALKVMNKKIAATPNSRTRFIEEARAMAAVHHDNVVVIFEVGEKGGTPFMAMELLKGHTLEAINLQKKQLDYEKILSFAHQITRGLAAAHEKGIVHRDIKPANIWVDDGNERIKILDFGLALAQTPVDRLGGSGSVVGTPGYLSPEQARTDPIDDRSDLYSLGVVLYELCTGRLPLAASTVSGQLVAILSHKPKPIRELNPDIPAPLAVLVQTLLAKEARERPASAKALEEQIKRVEVECHAKSEVALAINKLQEGLSLVVNKKQDEEIFTGEILKTAPIAAAADPFAFPTLPPAEPISPVPVALPNPNYSPRPVNRQTTPSGVDWKSIGPFIAIGVGAAILFPVLLYFLFASGDSNESGPVAQTTVNQPPSKPTPPKPTPSKPSPAKPTPAKPAPAKPTPAKVEPTKSQPVNPKAANSKPDKENPSKNSTNKPSNSPANKNANDAASKNNQEAKPKKAPELPPTSSEMKVNPVQPDSEPGSEKSIRTIQVSANDGRGADSSVRKGRNESVGENPVISILSRRVTESPIDIEHTYIRFDLSSLGKEKKQKISNAKIVLTMASGDRPTTGRMRLYGSDEPSSEVWEESGRFALTWKNSYSRIGLDAYPVLSEKIFTSKDEGSNAEVVIGGEGLTAFLKNAKTDTVTFILAGGRAEQPELISFASRERPDEGPRLEIGVAE